MLTYHYQSTSRRHLLHALTPQVPIRGGLYRGAAQLSLDTDDRRSASGPRRRRFFTKS